MDPEGRRTQSRLMEWLAVGMPAGSVAGVRVRLHFLLVLTLAYNWLHFEKLPYPLSWRVGLWAFSVIAIFGSVLAHELGHCYGARRVGGRAETVILWPLGGLAVVSGVEKGPKEEILITLLGPGVSLALAVAFTAVGWAIPPAWGRGFPCFFVLALAETNWMLAIFNMALPLFPMDCARIARGALSLRYNPNGVTYWLTTIGMWLGGAIAVASFTRLLGDFAGPWLGLIGLLGALTSYQERRRCQMMDVYLDGPWYWRDAIYRSDTAPQRKPLWAEVRDLARLLFPRPSGTASRRKRPARIVEASRPESLRQALKAELDEAIQREDFPRAAQLRDQIRQLDPGGEP